MSSILEIGRGILNSQPFSKLLGAELTSFEIGSAEISLLIRDELKQQHGFVHGGVISYLADNCMTFAGGSVFGDGVTAEYKMNYIRPAIGHKLVARSSVLSSGKRQAVCECRVFVLKKEGEVLVAAAQGTISKVEKI